MVWSRDVKWLNVNDVRCFESDIVAVAEFG